MHSYENMRPTKRAKYAYLGDRYDFRAMISISLLVGSRDRKKMIDTVNDIIIRIDRYLIEDDIYFVLGLLCQYESLYTNMGTIGVRRRRICLPG